jgi:hypothetical protein
MSNRSIKILKEKLSNYSIEKEIDVIPNFVDTEVLSVPNK